MLRMTPSRMAGMPVVLAYWLLVGTSAFVIPVVPTIEVCQAPACENSSRQSHFMEGTSLLLTMEDVANTKEILPISDFKKDQVVRVLDANTLKLKQNGVVTLAGVRMPSATSSNFQFPECISFAPAYKLRQLVPPNSDVLIKVGSTTATGKSAQAIVVVKQKQQQNNKNENALLMVNLELVRTGFGKVQKITSVDLKDYLDIDRMQHLEAHAREEGIGIFRRCDVDGGSSSSGVAAFEAQFEPLELTMETQWGDDGGKQVVREKSNGPVTPLNPGDIKGMIRTRLCVF